MIGGYRVESTIGRGSFGTVYAAVRVADGARAALKVMSGRVLEHTGGTDRFRREADLSRRLTHPNIVRVLDAGVDGSLLYTAFELLLGRAVEEEMERGGPMPVRRAAFILSEVLAGLGEAHRVGIIHRDIKPANLFLATSLSGPEQVKVLDFGVAKSTNPNTAAGLTRDGMALGTPAYMAPEQLAGNPLTAATDLFALGLVAAELLLGRFVYGPEVSALQILNERLSGRRPPIPTSVLDGPLGAIIARATAPDPTQRMQSAAEMRTAVLAVHASLPTDGPQSGTIPLAKSPAFAPTMEAPLRRPGANPLLAATTVDPNALPPSQPAPRSFNPKLAATMPYDASMPLPPPPRRPAKRSSTGLILALVALLVVVGVGGYLGWRFYSAQGADDEAADDVQDDDKVVSPGAPSP
jgi:serine/threonine protein kinase